MLQRLKALIAMALGTVGCAHDRVAAPIEGSYSTAVITGNAQRAPAGSVVPQPLSVRVTDALGKSVKGTRVVFSVRRGANTGSRMLDSVSVSDPGGVATAELQLGSALDTTTVVVYPSPAVHRAVTFVATATTPPVLLSISPMIVAGGDTVTLRGTGLGVVSAGGGAEFGAARAASLTGASDSVVRVVVPACLEGGRINVRVAAGTVRSNQLALTYQSRALALSLPQLSAFTAKGAHLAECLTLEGNGAAYLLVAQFAAVGSPTAPHDWRLGANATGTIAGAEPALASPGDNALQREFEGLLRRTEQAIAPRARAEADAARRDAAWLQQAAAPPAVGSTRAFQVVAALDGSKFTSVTARLRYAGEHLLLYVDTVGGGFSDEQYRALGTVLDRDLYPIGVAAFGSESDIDRNGRILSLFTPAVNALIRAEDCARGYVTGFFYGVDLLTQDPNSNKGEIFYSFVPDSSGVYSCAHTASVVLRTLPGTFVHEMQHMISFNQHVLARFGDVEDTWLNEGLSHIAEELGSKLYEARYPPPSGRTSAEQIFPDSAGPFITPQLFNAYIYLNSPRTHSVTSYNGTGSIEERGATWLFLRWLAEQKGEDVFRRLVQTSKRGIANVEDKAGETFGALFGDFSVALYADSLPGLPRAAVPARFRFGSRELRKLMARIALISGFSNPFPLPLFVLPVGGFVQAQMLPGTMSHALVNVFPGGGAFSLRLTRPDLTPFVGSEGAQVSIFRLPPQNVGPLPP